MVTDDTKTIKLPKPVTVTGSSFPDPKPDPIENVSHELDDESGELPMPVAVYEDVDEELPTVSAEPKINTQAPFSNLLPEIVPASANPSPVVLQDKAEQVQNDDSTTVALPPLPDLTKEEQALDDMPTLDFKRPLEITETHKQIDVEPQTVSLDNLPVAQSNSDQNQSFSLPQIDLNSVPEEINALSGNQTTNDYPNLSMQNTQIPTYEPPQNNEMPEINNPMIGQKKPHNNIGKVMLGIGVFLIGGGLVVGGYFGYNTLKGNSKTPSIAYQEPKVSPRPIQTPAASLIASPSATPKESPKVTPKATTKPNASYSLRVQIMNGSGKKGDTLVAKDIISSEKYDITTGNADNFDYLGLSIEYKEKYETVAQEFGKSLEKTYGKATLEATLKDSSEYDIVIILGSQTAKPTVSASPKSSASPSPKASTTPTPKP